MRSSFVPFVSASLIALTLVVACSGASQQDVLGGSPSSGGSGTPAPGTGDDAGAAEDTGTGTGPTVDASPPTQKDASGPDVDVPDVTEPPVDAGPPPGADPGITCGEDQGGTPRYCKVGEAICCRANNAYSCASTTSPSPCFGARISCDDDADCTNGEHCCAAMTQGPYTQLACTATCDPQSDVHFCDPNVPDGCAPGESCTGKSQKLPGYFYCQK